MLHVQRDEPYKGEGVSSEKKVTKNNFEQVKNDEMGTPVNISKSKSNESVSTGDQVEKKAHKSEVSLRLAKGDILGKALNSNNKSESLKTQPSLKDQLYGMNFDQIHSKIKEIKKSMGEIKQKSKEWTKLEKELKLCETFSDLSPNNVLVLGELRMKFNSLERKNLSGEEYEKELQPILKQTAEVLDKLDRAVIKHGIQPERLSEDVQQNLNFLRDKLQEQVNPGSIEVAAMGFQSALLIDEELQSSQTKFQELQSNPNRKASDFTELRESVRQQVDNLVKNHDKEIDATMKAQDLLKDIDDEVGRIKAKKNEVENTDIHNLTKKETRELKKMLKDSNFEKMKVDDKATRLEKEGVDTDYWDSYESDDTTGSSRQ